MLVEKSLDRLLGMILAGNRASTLLLRDARLTRQLEFLSELTLESELLSFPIEDIDGDDDQNTKTSQNGGWIDEMIFLTANIFVNCSQSVQLKHQ